MIRILRKTQIIEDCVQNNSKHTWLQGNLYDRTYMENVVRDFFLFVILTGMKGIESINNMFLLHSQLFQKQSIYCTNEEEQKKKKHLKI